MWVVGLTGGIGSGKSTVAAEFESLGVPVIDTDHLAHQLTRPPSPALALIRARFGEQALLPDGALDRAYIRERVFTDPVARQDLEAILHPLILDGVRGWLAGLPASCAYAIVVVPLLFETPSFHALADFSIAVDCDEDAQIARVALRNGLDEASIRGIIQAQMSAGERRKNADAIISNNASLQTLRQSVENLHHKLLLLTKNTR